WSSLELIAPRFESCGSVSQWIDADLDQVNVFTYFVAHLFLQTGKGCIERRRNCGTVCKDEGDRHGLVFDQVGVEMKRVTYLVENLDLRDNHVVANCT